MLLLFSELYTILKHCFNEHLIILVCVHFLAIILLYSLWSRMGFKRIWGFTKILKDWEIRVEGIDHYCLIQELRSMWSQTAHWEAAITLKSLWEILFVSFSNQWWVNLNSLPGSWWVWVKLPLKITASPFATFLILY